MSKQTNDKKAIAEMLEELEKLITWFDGADFSLEEALVKYQQAEVLSQEIDERLDTMKNEVSIIKKRFDS